METWLGRETDPDHCGGEGATVMEKSERHISAQRNTRMNPHSNWLGKREGLSFVSSCNQWGLKLGVLKVSVIGSVSLEDTGLLLERRQGKQPIDLQHGSSQ